MTCKGCSLWHVGGVAYVRYWGVACGVRGCGINEVKGCGLLSPQLYVAMYVRTGTDVRSMYSILYLYLCTPEGTSISF